MRSRRQVCLLGAKRYGGSNKLGPPVVPFHLFFWEGSHTKIGYSKKGTLIVTSLLEDLVNVPKWHLGKCNQRLEAA